MIEFSPEGRVCSFCGLVGGARAKFAGGFGAMICAECIDRYHELAHSPTGVETHQQAPWLDVTDAELLEKLPIIVKTGEQVDEFLHAWVTMLNQRKISWAHIGGVLGVTRQAAWERFSRPRSSQRAS